MHLPLLRTLAIVSVLLLGALHGVATTADIVKTANGPIQGTGRQPSGVRIFKGIPFAAPPISDLRWKEPQPVKNWTDIRKADQFGPRCMQAPVFGDMGFRANGMSEDCLYLNVWTPAKSGKERLPVLVYFYGGGFVAGDGDLLVHRLAGIQHDQGGHQLGDGRDRRRDLLMPCGQHLRVRFVEDVIGVRLQVRRRGVAAGRTSRRARHHGDRGHETCRKQHEAAREKPA